MKYFSMAFLQGVLRTISVVFNYLVIRLTSLSEFASISNFISVCNAAYQFCRLGYDYEFQKAIHDSKDLESKSKINAIYFILSFGLAIIASIISVLTLKFGFSEDIKVFGVPFSAVLFFVSSLFMTSFFFSNMYASYNSRPMIFLVSLNVILYSLLIFLLISELRGHYLIFYGFFMFVSICFTVLKFCTFNFKKVSFDLAKSKSLMAIKNTLPIYLNNTSIVISQIIVIALVSWINVDIVAEYRVLQSIQAVIALIPIITAIFFVNKTSEKEMNYRFLVLPHVYFILASISIMLLSFIAFLYPKYSGIILAYLPFFIFLNCITVISNAFIFSNYKLVDISLYLKILSVSMIINLLIIFYFRINSLQDLILLDVIMQIVLLSALFISCAKKLVFNTELTLNFLYFVFIFIISLNYMYFSSFYFSLVLIIISASYLIKKVNFKFYKN